METEQQLDVPNVTVSEEALKQIENVVKAQGEGKTLFLRLFVQAQGGGLSFGMALDTKKNSDDHSETHPSGLEVVIDSISYPYLRGASVSFTEGEKSGFSISSPNAELLASAHGGGCGGCSGDAGCCS
jgi:iron-sulfur cluster assembly accessory protein